jgi:hypothetical protein
MGTVEMASDEAPLLLSDTLSEDKKEESRPARDYHSSGFHDPYSDDNDSLLEPKQGDVKEDPNIEEGVDLLIGLTLADAPMADKTADKPKKKTKRKQSSFTGDNGET